MIPCRLQGGEVNWRNGDCGQEQTLTMQLAPPIVSCLGIGQLFALNSVVDAMGLVASLYQLFHRAMLLAEVLKVGHASSLAASIASAIEYASLATSLAGEFIK